MRVLVADEHPLICRGLRRLLEGEGYDVVAEAQCGGDVPALIAEHQPDALVADPLMPGLGGPTILPQLRAIAPELEVVFLGDTEDRRVIRTAFEMGAADYLPKSAEPGKVLAAVRQAVTPTSTRSQRGLPPR